jgi:hypothetical protein
MSSDNSIWIKQLYVDNHHIHFDNNVELKTTDDGNLVTTTQSGVQKIIGAAGAQGLKGDTGAAGAAGAAGAQGLKGDTGAAGAAGADGAQGLKGDTGAAGAAGADGAQGLKGDTGAAGAAGAAGADGTTDITKYNDMNNIFSYVMNDTFTSNNNIYNGIFLAVSENPNIIITYVGSNGIAGAAGVKYNTDGCSGPETGTCNISPPETNFTLYPIIMNNGQIGLYTYVGISGVQPKLFLSSDGINYNLKSTVPTTQVTSSKIIFVDSVFYCLINSTSEPSLFRSPNGIDWTMISLPKSVLHGIVSNKNGFLIGKSSASGMSYSSDNGLTWTINTTTYGSVYMNTLEYSPERKEFLGFVQSTCNFYYSKDGITFTNYIFKPDTDISVSVGSLMYIGFDVCRYFIPYIDKSTGFCGLCVSSDGLNWNTRIVTNIGRIGTGPGNIAYSNNYKRFFRMWYTGSSGPNMTYSTRSSNTSANNFITSKLIPTNNNELASKLYVDSTKKSLLAIFGCNKITANKNYYEFNGNTTSIESSQTSTTTKFIVPFALTVTNVSYLFSENVSPFASFAILKNNITQGNLIANTTAPNTILNGAIALATPVSFVAGDICEVVGTSDSITGKSLIVLYFN